MVVVSTIFATRNSMNTLPKPVPTLLNAHEEMNRHLEDDTTHSDSRGEERTGLTG